MGVRSASLSFVVPLAVFAVACGAGADSSGAPGGFGGGASTTTTSTSSSSGSTSTSTGTGGSGQGGGAGGSIDCPLECGAQTTPAAVELYGALATCVYCDQCYVDCPAPPTPVTCTDPPTGTPCEQGDCQLCAQCALEGACAPAREACQSDPDCVAYGNCLALCGKK